MPSAVSTPYNKKALHGGQSGTRIAKPEEPASTCPEPSTTAPAHPAEDFDAFYQQQHDHVRYFLAAHVRDRQLAHGDFDDVLNETFARAWKNRNDCRFKPAGWIIGIAKHAVQQYGRQAGSWRKRKEAGVIASRYEHSTGEVRRDAGGTRLRASTKAEPDALREQISIEQRTDLTARLLAVDPSGLLLEALRLHYIEGLDWNQCAAKVDRSSRWLRNKRAEAGLPLTPQRRRRDREGGE